MLTVLPWSLVLKFLLLISSCGTQLQTWHRTTFRAKAVCLKTCILEDTKCSLDHI